MKKYLLLIILLLCLTGCDVHYEGRFEDLTYYENTAITVDPTKEERYSEMPLRDYLHSFVNQYIPSFYNPQNYDEEETNFQSGVEYYQISDFDSSGILTSYAFNFYQIHRSRMIKACFPEIDVQKNENFYRIHTNTGCDAFQTYPLLSNLTIDLTVSYPVISNNADLVNENHYIWYLTKENASEKNIQLSFSTVVDDFSDFDSSNVPDDHVPFFVSWANQHVGLVLVICFSLFFLLIMGVLIYQKRKK